MAVYRESFYEWKNHPVTQEMLNQIRMDMEDYVAKMVNRDRPDEMEDQKIRAYVKFGTDMLGWVPEFYVEPQEESVDDIED